MKRRNLKTNVAMIVLNSVIHDSRVLREARLLLVKGYNVKIFGIIDQRRRQYSGDVDIDLINIWLRYRLPKNNVGWFLKYVEFCLKVISKIFHSKPDIIHAHDLDALLPGYLASLLTQAKVVYDSHELYTETGEKQDTIINKMWGLVEKKLLRKVAGIIAANKSRARIMKTDYGAPYLPTVIMNIPSIEFISKSRLFRDYMSSRGVLNVDRKHIALYQGGISRNRSLDALIRSVTNWNTKILLILMGYGDEDYLGYLRNLVYELAVEKRVFFHPAVPSAKVLEYTASADIGIVIYRNNCRNNYFCAPNKLFEYAAARVKIAGCDFPEVRRILEEYGIGCTFSPDSEISISECINRLSRTKVEEKRFLNLFKDYNWENEAKKLVNLYKQVSL
jgi:glycosyltransferase involved in cell wall biosynthesis